MGGMRIWSGVPSVFFCCCGVSLCVGRVWELKKWPRSGHSHPPSHYVRNIIAHGATFYSQFRGSDPPTVGAACVRALASFAPPLQPVRVQKVRPPKPCGGLHSNFGSSHFGFMYVLGGPGAWVHRCLRGNGRRGHWRANCLHILGGWPCLQHGCAPRQWYFPGRIIYRSSCCARHPKASRGTDP